jgi:hypothetical protein
VVVQVIGAAERRDRRPTRVEAVQLVRGQPDRGSPCRGTFEVRRPFVKGYVAHDHDPRTTLARPSKVRTHKEIAMSQDRPLDDDDITGGWTQSAASTSPLDDADHGDLSEESDSDSSDGVDQGAPGGTYGSQDSGDSDSDSSDGMDQGVPGGRHGPQDSSDG